jgi:hypothetical protein
VNTGLLNLVQAVLSSFVVLTSIGYLRILYQLKLWPNSIQAQFADHTNSNLTSSQFIEAKIA